MTTVTDSQSEDLAVVTAVFGLLRALAKEPAAPYEQIRRLLMDVEIKCEVAGIRHTDAIGLALASIANTELMGKLYRAARSKVHGHVLHVAQDGDAVQLRINIIR